MDPEKEISFKEKRIREIVFLYYLREDVKKALFDFSKHRECVPRYFEGFGKRPDAFQYGSDILEQVKKGATSFHCSEELWEDPLEISTELSREQFNDLRIGWDLLLDIDSPYLEYSKIYADLIVKALEFHGVKNIGVKFSGSKGLHIIIPWKAFPEQLYGQKTKDMFPEWPRLICEYLTTIIRPRLADKIFEQESLKDLAKKTGKKQEDLLITECLSCHRSATKKALITWLCPHCKNQIVNIEGTFNNRKKPRCPDCRKDLQEVSRQEIYFCEFCQINSKKNSGNFAETREKTETLIEADLILVAPRHLFRMPYSLHEKTALASIVLDKDKIKNFQIKDANALKIEIKNFYPDAKPGEAKELLLQALDWKEQKNKQEQQRKEINKQQIPQNLETTNKKLKKGEYKQIEIPSPTEELYPPCIKLLLKGVKNDGRKRALFILINFFKSLGTAEQNLIEIIEKWNKENYNPLKQGYIQSQLNWYRKKPARMPPNCDKISYQDLNICLPDELCRQIKNPVNYAMKKYFKSNR
jgi:ribosomal protein L37AE/L43A